MNCETLQDYLDRYGPLVAERARQAFEPLHVPTTDAVITLDLKRPMLPAQAHVVTAAVKTLKRQKAVYLCCECGCLGGENEIYDPVAKAMLRVDEITEPFHVWSYDEATGRRVIGRALVPFVKGIRNLYRVRLSNGREFVSTDHHRLLAENAWLSVRVCGRLPLEFDTDRPLSILDTCLSTSPASVPHSRRTLQCSQGDCLPYHRSGGGQLPLAEAGDRVFVPQQDGVRGHTHACLHQDGLASTALHNRPQPCDHLSKSGLSGHAEAHLYSAFELRHAAEPSSRFPNYYRCDSRCRSLISRLQDTSESCRPLAIESPLSLLSSKGDGTPVYITGIAFLRQDFYYDFTVEQYHT